MKRILILSDTHNLLRPEVLARAALADAILHAGDISTPAVLNELRALAPTHAVRGNNDKDWPSPLPDTRTVELEGLRIFLVHNKKDVPAPPPAADLIVYGHSHRYAEQTRDGTLWLNPGSCGKRRFDQEITFCELLAENGHYTVEKHTIPHPQRSL